VAGVEVDASSSRTSGTSGGKNRRDMLDTWDSGSRTSVIDELHR
jgi:hypothetical protein